MKFLVLALCVCAASAASAASYGSFGNNKQKKYQGFGSAVVPPAARVAEAAVVVSAPVVDPVASTTLQASKQVKNTFSEDGQAEILSAKSEVRPDGFDYAYETANNIVAEAVGSLKKIGDSVVLVSQGSYRYISPDGTPVLVTYTADENGFRAQGDHLPVEPEIPEAIRRSIAFNAARSQNVVQN